MPSEFTADAMDPGYCKFAKTPIAKGWVERADSLAEIAKEGKIE